MSATAGLPPAEHHEVLEENATTGRPPSLNDLTHARSSSPASRNSPGRVRLAKKAASVLYSGIPRRSIDSSFEPLHLPSQSCVGESIEEPEVEPGDDAKKAGMSLTNLARRLVRKICRSSGVRDAPSWHQPLENGSDVGGKKFKGVASPPPVYDAPYATKNNRLWRFGSARSVNSPFLRSSAPSPEERPQHLGGAGTDYDEERYLVPRCPLAPQTSSHATHLPTNQPQPSKHKVSELSADSAPPTKRPRLYSLTHRWARTANTNPTLSTDHTASTSSSPKGAVSKAFNALLGKGS